MSSVTFSRPYVQVIKNLVSLLYRFSPDFFRPPALLQVQVTPPFLCQGTELQAPGWQGAGLGTFCPGFGRVVGPKPVSMALPVGWSLVPVGLLHKVASQFDSLSYFAICASRVRDG